ncbi:hypothetical protein KSP40_PGU019894 [Platanthera guangdongensis]|uniref:Uncharacterized protein n=1 Tax=Platanthera guangdongensis TaxID=2320717 RepID=A0ABR2LL75_9ASPA
MFLGLFSEQRCASSAFTAEGFPLLGFNLVERREVHEISEDAGGENLLEEAYACKVLSMSKLGGVSSMAQFVVDIPLRLIEVREKQGAQSSEANGRRYWSSCAAPPGKNLVCIFPLGEIYIKGP